MENFMFKYWLILSIPIRAILIGYALHIGGLI
jgi:hypothetical protein